MSYSAIFLHSMFRTGSTYLWNKFRKVDRYYCYYEPLHHIMTDLTSTNVDSLLVGDYDSVHHPRLEKHYLYEYEPLLKHQVNVNATGVPYFKKEFSYEQFCKNDENPELKQYFEFLLSSAGGKIPVLKFNRTGCRAEWFKEYFPQVFHLYIVRNPRDQWESYNSILKRTGYNGFFMIDLLTASVNNTTFPFDTLARNLPLFNYRMPKHEDERHFYKLLLDVYSLEEKYFIFYYTWLYALLENLSHTPFIFNINRFCKNTGYRQAVYSRFEFAGYPDIRFDDCKIDEYPSYTLPLPVMEQIEEEVFRCIAPLVSSKKLDALFNATSVEDAQYFNLSPERFTKYRDVDNKPGEISFPDIRDKKIEKLEAIVSIFSKINFSTDILQQYTLWRDLKITSLNKHIEDIYASRSFRIGRMVSSPVIAAKKFISGIRRNVKENVHRHNWNLNGKYERKIDLGDQGEINFGRHRSGLKYGIRYLGTLHKKGGILFDAFIERTFHWHPREIKPHTRPWIGFIHVPPHLPDWFHADQANDVIFNTSAWKQSLPLCRGLYTLSKYHRESIEVKLDIPVNNLIFPTEIPQIKWSWEKFSKNNEKKIIQVGWWLRKLHAIYQLPRTSYKKIFLSVEHESIPGLIRKEREVLKNEGTFDDNMYHTAETITYLSDGLYDRVLSENIVFIYLYDASANNTVTECIARCTPILVNPIEPVLEYLGEDYPFYYSSLEEAAEKAMNFDLVRETHEYLLNLPIRQKLSGEYFLESFVNSPIYKSL